MPVRRPLPGTERGSDAAASTFDLEYSLARLKDEECWASRDQNAVTLAKTAGLRVVLVALKEGARIRPHRADSQLTLQVLEGELELDAPDGPVRLRKGQLLALQPGVPHDVRAVSEAAFLLTLAAGESHPAERAKLGLF